MNKIEESKLNMYDAVIAFCSANQAIVSSVPAFQAAFTSFQSTVSDIHLAAQAEASVITGIAADKSQLKAALCSHAVELASCLYAFAAASGNQELKAQVSFTPHAIGRIKDGMLVPACANIRDAAAANLAALAAYGITPATIAHLQDAMDGFAAKLAAPRNALSRRAACRTSIKLLFKKGDGIIKEQMDKIATRFRSTSKDFYDAYKNNRVIIDAASSPTQIAGIITSASDGEPMHGATVEMAGQPISTTTDANGNYLLRHVAIGIHSIRVNKPGYADVLVENISVKLGRTSTVNASLSPER